MFDEQDTKLVQGMGSHVLPLFSAGGANDSSVDKLSHPWGGQNCSPPVVTFSSQIPRSFLKLQDFYFVVPDWR